MFLVFLFATYFSDARDQIEDFAHTKQVLYHWASYLALKLLHKLLKYVRIISQNYFLSISNPSLWYVLLFESCPYAL